MPSRLLARLDAQIAVADGSVAAACLRARKATYLARQGREQEAAAIVATIREAFGKVPNAEVTAWVSLVERSVRERRLVECALDPRRHTGLDPHRPPIQCVAI